MGDIPRNIREHERRGPGGDDVKLWVRARGDGGAADDLRARPRGSALQCRAGRVPFWRSAASEREYMEHVVVVERAAEAARPTKSAVLTT